jgi:hypothetical protein
MVKFGLAPGSPDLVGWAIIDDRAIFVGLEVKLPGEKPRPDQRHFLETIRSAGGIAGVVTSVDEALTLLTHPPVHKSPGANQGK